MSILFAGTPQIAADSLRGLLSAGLPISLVLTREDAPVGRRRLLSESPVASVASEFGIPVVKANQVDDGVLGLLAGRGIELGLVIAYGVLLKELALEVFPRGWFNIHFSLLPKFRGAAPVQRALIAGESETGVTIFKIDRGLDTGPILASASTVIEVGENSGELLPRLGKIGVSLASEAVPSLLAGIEVLRGQDDKLATYAPKISREDAFVNFKMPALQIENLVRGCNPEPGAWALTLNGSHVKIHEAIARDEPNIEIGLVDSVNNRILVGTPSGSLELKVVQMAGKNRMDAGSWFRGIPIATRFVTGE